MESPPLTPLRQRFSTSSTSPEQRRPISRRSSSISSARAAGTRRSSYSNHRLSNASRYSNGMDDFASPTNQQSGGGGMGNLADELDFADEDEDEDEGGDWEGGSEDHEQLAPAEDAGYSTPGQSTPFDQKLHEPPQTDGARDSGVDVGYRSSPSPTATKTSSSAFRKASAHQQRLAARRPSSRHTQEDAEDKFSIELEDAMRAVAELAQAPSGATADTSARTVSALQDLSPQTTIEAHSRRLSLSMNSISSQLLEQAKFLQSLSSTLFSPFAIASSLNMLDPDELSSLMVIVLHELPLPDVRALQGLGKLDKETNDLVSTLSGLLDSLQMSKQAATSAARHLRATQTVTTELRRESERAEEARFLIEKEGWDQKLAGRWCAAECRDVVEGFDQVCNGLRKGLEESAA